MTKAWDPIFPASPLRSRKPRQKGVTMVLDKCHGLRASEDLLDTAGDRVRARISSRFGASYSCRVRPSQGARREHTGSIRPL